MGNNLTLVVVESPTKAKTMSGYFQNNFIVLASCGHVRRLPRKSGSVLPTEDFKMIWEDNPNTQKYMSKIIEAAVEVDKNKGEIILATDPDREGESIANHIATILREKGISSKIKRIIFQEITKSKILEAIRNPVEINKDKVDSYFARLSLDYLVGFTISPLLWTKLKNCKSAGRVQSAVLRAIIERELETIRFKSEKYWTLSSLFLVDNIEYSAQLAEWNKKPLEKFMWTEESVKEAKNVLEKDSYKITSIESKKQTRSPLAPFITSTLQQEAAKVLGWSSSKVMRTAQRLYEGVSIGKESTGLITYMRTDSTRISDDSVKQCLEVIKSNFGNEYVCARKFTNKSSTAQDAHEAIRPTNFSLTPESLKTSLDQDMLRLYNLIWRKAVMSQMSDAEYLITNIFIEGENGKWKIHGRKCQFDGFTKLLYEKEEEIQQLNNISDKDKVSCKEIKTEEHLTQPKGRFSESSIIKHMDEVGIGRPSTYASIIDTLENREYISRQNKKILPLPKGWIVTGFLDDYLDKYIRDDFTAKMEEDLDKVNLGQINWKDMIGEFWKSFEPQIEKLKIEESKQIISSISNKYNDYFVGQEASECPNCGEGKKTLCIFKNSEFLGCSRYPSCDWRRGLNQKETKGIGVDPTTNEEIVLKDGKYGKYLNWTESKKNIAVPEYLLKKIDLETALKLKSLPIILGVHPFTQKEIKLNIGRYGLYLEYNSIYISCKSIGITEMTLEKALELLGASRKLKKAESEVATKEEKNSTPL